MNTKSAKYQWLKENGYLESPESIEVGSKIYLRVYHKKHKQLSRLKKKDHVIGLTPEEAELIDKHTEGHYMTKPQFMRKAALAYCTKSYVVPRNPEMLELQQQFILFRSQIARLSKEQPSMFGKSRDEKIEALVSSMEIRMRDAFKTPEDAETVIRQALETNPAFIVTLKALVAEYADQK